MLNRAYPSGTKPGKALQSWLKGGWSQQQAASAQSQLFMHPWSCYLGTWVSAVCCRQWEKQQRSEHTNNLHNKPSASKGSRGSHSLLSVLSRATWCFHTCPNLARKQLDPCKSIFPWQKIDLTVGLGCQGVGWSKAWHLFGNRNLLFGEFKETEHQQWRFPEGHNGMGLREGAVPAPLHV